MAHTPVRKCVKDRLCSVSWTIIGLRSYMKNTPAISQTNSVGMNSNRIQEVELYTPCRSRSPRLIPSKLNVTCWNVGVATWKDGNGAWECTSCSIIHDIVVVSTWESGFTMNCFRYFLVLSHWKLVGFQRL
jgi:hypothetical protein